MLTALMHSSMPGVVASWETFQRSGEGPVDRPDLNVAERLSSE
jgi:hypothetical protein